MFEAAMRQMVELGHDVNAEHWTRGERGFSNVCLNCGRVIGVLKTGELWGTALSAPCPDRKWYTVSKQNRGKPSQEPSAGRVFIERPQKQITPFTEVPRPKYQTLKRVALLLGVLAIPVVLIAVLVHFQLLSGLMVVLARISLAVCVITLIAAVFVRKGFTLALLSLVLAIVFAFLSHVLMSPQQKAVWNARQVQEQQKQDAEHAAAKADAAKREQDAKAVDEKLQEEQAFLHRRGVVAGNAAVKAAEWTRRQVAPFVVTFDCPPLEDSDVCNFAYSPKMG